ncbi:TPA: hypothetical protein EYP27_06110 [Candidatus Bathyarchaeota archaeon]|nr:hypothetical protein [Candidatus Bathyarchaeota archaeon]
MPYDFTSDYNTRCNLMTNNSYGIRLGGSDGNIIYCNMFGNISNWLLEEVRTAGILLLRVIIGVII